MSVSGTAGCLRSGGDHLCWQHLDATQADRALRPRHVAKRDERAMSCACVGTREGWELPATQNELERVLRALDPVETE